jgi:hypothetical protein
MAPFHRSLNMALLILFSLAVFSCSDSRTADTAAQSAASPSIKGTYKLVSRQLADGTVLKPPQIMGLFTYTDTYRNFNIVGEDAMGKFYGSLGATYTLTPTEYSQTQLFNVASDTADRTKVVYDVAEKTATAPVKMDSGRIEFKLPGDEPTVVFEGTKLTATQPGMFVDVWERIP